MLSVELDQVAPTVLPSQLYLYAKRFWLLGQLGLELGLLPTLTKLQPAGNGWSVALTCERPVGGSAPTLKAIPIATR